MAKEYSAKETELKAEAKVLGQKRILQTQERQAMLKAVMDVYGRAIYVSQRLCRSWSCPTIPSLIAV